MIKLHRGVPDRLLPKDFLSIVMHQYFPVLSLTYVTNVCAVVYAEQGSFFGLVDYDLPPIVVPFIELVPGHGLGSPFKKGWSVA
jgi:hypothetical protein